MGQGSVAAVEARATLAQREQETHSSQVHGQDSSRVLCQLCPMPSALCLLLPCALCLLLSALGLLPSAFWPLPSAFCPLSSAQPSLLLLSLSPSQEPPGLDEGVSQELVNRGPQEPRCVV